MHDHAYLCTYMATTVQRASYQENCGHIVETENIPQMFVFPSCSKQQKGEWPTEEPSCAMLHPPLAGGGQCCWGDKTPHFAAAVLQGVSLSSQDCLQEIRDFLRKHMDFISTLLGVTIGFMVAMSVPVRFGPKGQAPVGEAYPKLAPRS